MSSNFDIFDIFDNDDAWSKAFHKMDIERRDKLPENLRELEIVGSKEHIGIFCFHYPYSHPHAHFKNSITITDDGFPQIRLFPLDTECKRLKVVQYRFQLMANPKNKNATIFGRAFMKYLKEKGESYMDFSYEVFKEFLECGYHHGSNAIGYLK